MGESARTAVAYALDVPPPPSAGRTRERAEALPASVRTRRSAASSTPWCGFMACLLGGDRCPRHCPRRPLTDSEGRLKADAVGDARPARRGSPPTLSPVQETLDVSNDVAAELAGIGDGVLDALRDRLDCTIRLRGNQLTIEGDDSKVAEARAVVDELVDLVESGQEIGAGTVDTVLNALDQAEDVRTIFEAVVWSPRGKKITPKTVTQKRYVDAIRRCTVTFAIGPAGTGKTYLAIALAVAALQERQVGRIILTRPAVEAGERLGFLPGDVLAKRSEEHTSELQSHSDLVCRLLLEK